MEAIKITTERMNQILPKEIRETNELSSNAKKVLAVIINYHFVHEKVKNAGYLAINNATLRNSVELKMNKMKDAISELIECNLIKREAGKTWKHGEKHTASTYTVYWDNLKKEIKKPTFDELFEAFNSIPKSSETTMGSITTTITPTVTSTSNTSFNSSINSNTVFNINSDTSSDINSDVIFENETKLDYDSIEDDINNEEYQKKMFKKALEQQLKFTAMTVARENHLSIE